MNCGFCHEKILARPLREAAEACGATVSAEHTVRMGGTVSFADLVITKDGRTIVCEPEQSRHRVSNDVRKAAALGAQAAADRHAGLADGAIVPARIAALSAA